MAHILIWKKMDSLQLSDWFILGEQKVRKVAIGRSPSVCDWRPHTNWTKEINVFLAKFQKTHNSKVL